MLDIPKFLVVSTTIGFFSMLGLIVLRPLPNESKDIINVMLGSVATAWGTIVMYHFGSSAGSAKKTDMMNAADEKKEKA